MVQKTRQTPVPLKHQSLLKIQQTRPIRQITVLAVMLGLELLVFNIGRTKRILLPLLSHLQAVAALAVVVAAVLVVALVLVMLLLPALIITVAAVVLVKARTMIKISKLHLLKIVKNLLHVMAMFFPALY
ncbi:hypothetical protein Pgy4_42479 [Pseudomonas savastanoi pv. glycinea str. race 4]|uniref:Uncharacterized protein n=1 Tax=Pseudomonas savastanoi pv. glycinea str. race 4 TaxID=875330 RepID=E7PP05_PSESG|nr:hypothetical protein PsgRace4_17643 [Pseudomonas savastanoi pv. glycinea str. race 4]EGH19651.1 hypothetical protein Pgy4_42479 [Pseudomonas savastanoi pv. glycinea str. race 4]